MVGAVTDTGNGTVVVGVDGSGRTHRLRAIAAAAPGALWFSTSPAVPVAEFLTDARHRDALVIVDDAHRLDSADLRVLAAAARDGVPMAVSRRPTVDRPELAELDGAVAARGRVEVLAPLDLAAVAALLRQPDESAAPVLRASAGLPAIVLALVDARADPAPPALVARVHRELAFLPAPTVALARVLALRLDLSDEVLAAAAGLSRDQLEAAIRSLRDAGLLVPDGERVIPAVAEAILADLPAAGRRRAHDAVAHALVGAGADPVLAATQLRAARVSTPAAAEVYRAAGEQTRFTDPAAAASWYDDAADAGADPIALAAGRTEAGALLGLPVDPAAVAVPAPEAGRLALVDGAVAAHQGRSVRAAQRLSEAPPPGPVLAVPSLVATGRAAEARAALESAGTGAGSVARLAEAVLAVGDPEAALPLLIEAAEAAEATPPALVLPDTPHALGAVVAVAAGDADSAEHLLVRAAQAGVGGPVAADRHRLLLAWVHLRTGRYDTAAAEVRRSDGAALAGRDRLLHAALAAGLARRSGDIASLRDAWSRVAPVLARGAVDLFVLEAIEEFAVAAARLRELRRVVPALEALDVILDGLGSPPAWTTALGWIRLQLAAAVEDATEADRVARQLAAVKPAGHRPRALCAAATCWAGALAGQVDGDEVVAATDELVAAELPWEASRLAGQAAIRTTDAPLARRLLERARDLSGPDSSGAPTTQLAGLSEREVEVARLVLSGATYREIGARLFISPKTVEHHVARIRTKLGATTRAEFVAALRGVLAAD